MTRAHVENPELSRARSLASAATIVIPVGVGVVLFLAAWLSNTASGAGLSEDNRPIAVYMQSAIGAAGWFIGTSAVYAIHRSADRLPRTARLCALLLIRGSSSMRLHEAHPGSNGDVVPPARTSASVRQLVGWAAFTLPLMMFLPPMLLGWLAQPDVWRPDETPAVGAMGAFVVAWSLYLVARARESR